MLMAPPLTVHPELVFQLRNHQVSHTRQGVSAIGRDRDQDQDHHSGIDPLEERSVVETMISPVNAIEQKRDDSKYTMRVDAPMMTTAEIASRTPI